jgi:DNA-binding NarL/FixJ family response regulator
MEMQTQPPARAAVRVFLVEDSAAIADRLRAMLSSIAGAAVVGQASRAAEAVEKILAERPDVVVLDLKLAQGDSGFDVLRAVHAKEPSIDVYLLSNFSTRSYRQVGLKLGAKDFFDKTGEFNRVRDIVAERAASASRGPQ